MKIFQAALLISACTFFFANAGENYEKVCKRIRKMGKDGFKDVITVLYSQKFANGTFEEITAVADYMLKLAEQCCSEHASPNCYNEGENKLAEIICGKDSLFPKHPDLPTCCAEEDKTRLLCMASLRCSTEELPSLHEATSEEICEDFKKDSKIFSARYCYEFSRRYRSIPAGLVIKAKENHVKMAEKCCSPTVSKTCFLVERLQHMDFNTFLRFASSVCQNARYLKDNINALMVYYGSLLKLPFEEALRISHSLHDDLKRCCSEENSECLTNKLTGFQKTLCNDSLLGLKSEEFQRCCGKAPLDTLSCVDTLERHVQLLPGVQQPPLSDFCGAGDQKAMQRFLFEVGSNYPSVPASVFASFSEIFSVVQKQCCSASNVTACLESSMSITVFLSKTEDVCSKYIKLDFTEFKKVMLADVQSKEPELSKEEAEAMAKIFIDFSLSCCARYAPARKCKKLVEEMIVHKKND
ncbi:vitamin D-binding protein [Arapaima gigas]